MKMNGYLHAELSDNATFPLENILIDWPKGLARPQPQQPKKGKTINPYFEHPIAYALLTAMNIDPRQAANAFVEIDWADAKFTRSEDSKFSINTGMTHKPEGDSFTVFSVASAAINTISISLTKDCNIYYSKTNPNGIITTNDLPESIMGLPPGMPLKTIIDIEALNHLDVSIEKIDRMEFSPKFYTIHLAPMQGTCA